MDREPLPFNKEDMTLEKIAIIGTGIAGMSAGYFLRHRYDITFFEKENYAGGHTNTLAVDEDGQPVYIDSAFMVFNHFTYPNLIKFFKVLDIEEKDTNMSFSVQHLPTGLEYCGTGLNGLFAQRRNVFNPAHYRMLLDINRFNKESLEVLDSEEFIAWSIERYIKERGYTEDMLHKYLIPMSSAVWSTPPEMMLEFPIVTLVRFFKNHGFLGLKTQFQWKTLCGGSRQYRDKVMGLFKDKVFLNCWAVNVLRKDKKVEVQLSNGEKKMFDKVVLASHADQSLALLGDPTIVERSLLSHFKYQKNRTTLHTDESLMPKNRLAWSSWNYRIKETHGRVIPSTTYYMNKLQQVSKRRDYFVTINNSGDIDPAKILWEKEYEHPLFDVNAIRAQKELPLLNVNGTTYFCGAYFKYGFHEDGFNAGMDVAQNILGELQWN